MSKVKEATIFSRKERKESNRTQTNVRKKLIRAFRSKYPLLDRVCFRRVSFIDLVNGMNQLERRNKK